METEGSRKMYSTMNNITGQSKGDARLRREITTYKRCSSGPLHEEEGSFGAMRIKEK